MTIGVNASIGVAGWAVDCVKSHGAGYLLNHFRRAVMYRRSKGHARNVIQKTKKRVKIWLNPSI